VITGLLYEQDMTGNDAYPVGVYHLEGLGSVRAVTDQNATVQETYLTDEFGILLRRQGNNNQVFQFTGDER